MLLHPLHLPGQMALLSLIGWPKADRAATATGITLLLQGTDKNITFCSTASDAMLHVRLGLYQDSYTTYTVAFFLLQTNFL
jgi:hypothetical protein